MVKQRIITIVKTVKWKKRVQIKEASRENAMFAAAQEGLKW